MSALTAIAASEFRMLFRNSTVLSLALILPLALGAVFIFAYSDLDFSFAIGLYIAAVAPLSVYTSITTAVVARRQELFLKRLRTSSASPLAILLGVSIPSAILFVVQVGIVSAIMLSRGFEAPAALWLFVVAALLYTAVNVVAGLITSPFTQSAAAAQITVMPLFLVFMGSAIMWPLAQSSDLAIAPYITLLPGGALMQLITDSTTNIFTNWTWIALAALVVTIALGLWASVRAMKWEKR